MQSEEGAETTKTKAGKGSKLNRKTHINIPKLGVRHLRRAQVIPAAARSANRRNRRQLENQRALSRDKSCFSALWTTNVGFVRSTYAGLRQCKKKKRTHREKSQAQETRSRTAATRAPAPPPATSGRALPAWRSAATARRPACPGSRPAETAGGKRGKK